MGIVESIALAMGASWASGINLYAALLMLGILGATEAIALPPDLMILAEPAVIMAAGFMYFVEFVADKTPGADTGWDAIHTFIRIPAGAVLAAGAIGDVSPAAELAAIIAGGSLAATAHATKTGTRMLINTSPEPFSNWAASIAGDLAVIGGLWVALYNPEVFLVLLATFILLAIWLLPKIWRGLKAVVAAIARWLDGRNGVQPEHSRPANAGDARFELTLRRDDGSAPSRLD